MYKVLTYTILDLFRNPWTWTYTTFFALCTSGLLYLDGSSSKVVVSLMNISILLIPLISLIFGMIYLYQVVEYVEIMIIQPISRTSIFTGYLLGLTLVLVLAVFSGIVIPLLVFNPSLLFSPAWGTLLFICIVLTMIFSSIAGNLVLKHNNKLKGFGIGLFIWLLLAVLYDGFFLVMLFSLEEYPLENIALGALILNPIDMGRVMLLFQMDFSALMGFTGAVYKNFFGTALGMVILSLSYLIWTVSPWITYLRKVRKRDF